MALDFDKMGGLIPAIIQDAGTKNVLMLGFMNPEAYEKTLETKQVRIVYGLKAKQVATSLMLFQLRKIATTTPFSSRLTL